MISMKLTFKMVRFVTKLSNYKIINCKNNVNNTNFNELKPK